MVIKNSNFKNNNAIGQIFTPNYIAEFMVKNILGFIQSYGKKPQTLSVLEPSAGEGIFLKFLLKNNFLDITAYEMDTNLKENLLNSYPNVQFKFDNFLGSDPNKKFDLIIGNPPYLGQNYNAKIFQEYVREFPFCSKYFVGNMDLFYFFIHLGIEKLNSGGFLSFITTNYWITKSKKTGIKLLKPHVLEECFLRQYIDLTHLKVFEGAKGQHNCIFVLQKKTEHEKIQKKNTNIEIIHLLGINHNNQKAKTFNEEVFKSIARKENSSYINRYKSALTNNDLRKDKNWNLIYPKAVQAIVDKIENFCKIEGKTTLLNNYFVIRNGLILIKDSFFILSEEKQLKIKDNDFFVHVDGEFLKLTELEKTRLKKIYKSKSIKPYGYNQEDFVGYVIYFSKYEFKQQTNLKRNYLLKQKYPNLAKYLQQYEEELREILINAKENPNDFYFPRRGSFIRQFEAENKENLIDLEPLYDKAEKIFFKFISKENIFGYSNISYYATSDTYFLWPKVFDKKIDYLFILAYLNSKLIYFLFKAKNISVKRSKTKLEQGLPMPYLQNFEGDQKKPIFNLIKKLTFYLTNRSDENFMKNTNDYIEKVCSLNIVDLKDKKFKNKLINAIQNKDNKTIEKVIDRYMFMLFELDEGVINNLLNDYYDF